MYAFIQNFQDFYPVIISGGLALTALVTILMCPIITGVLCFIFDGEIKMGAWEWLTRKLHGDNFVRYNGSYVKLKEKTILTPFGYTMWHEADYILVLVLILPAAVLVTLYLHLLLPTLFYILCVLGVCMFLARGVVRLHKKLAAHIADDKVHKNQEDCYEETN